MRNLHWVVWAAAVAVLVGGLSFGCSAGDGSGVFGSGGSAASAASAGTGGLGAFGGTGGGDHSLLSVTVSPIDHILEVDLNAPETMDYTATANYADGTTEDVTDVAGWSSSNAALGSFNGSTLEIPGFTQAMAETTLVTADYQGVEGLAQLTVVAYRQSGTQQDFFFVLPYEDPAGDQDKPLDFSTNVPSLDVFFAMDTTGSMDGIVNGLQASVNSVIMDIQTQIADSQFGVGAYEDYPIYPYGENPCTYGALGGPDQPFELFQEITANASLVQTGVNGLGVAGNAIGCGNDWPESMVEALFQVATGAGLSSPAPTNVPPNTSGVGGVGYRDGSMPVVVPMSDARSHNGILGENYGGTVATVAATRQEAIDALDAICARVVGVAANGWQGLDADPDIIAMAEATGAVVPPVAWGTSGRPAGCNASQCCTGQNGVGRAPNGSGVCPLSFVVSSTGTGLGQAIVTGLDMLTRFATFDVVTETEGQTTGTKGEPLPPGTTTADFIVSIVPLSAVKPTNPPGLPDPIIDTGIGGFRDVTPGTVVTFEVTAFNDFVEQTNEAQFFEATIRVLAGGCTPLDERTVLILVPPAPVGPPR